MPQNAGVQQSGRSDAFSGPLCGSGSRTAAGHWPCNPGLCPRLINLAMILYQQGKLAEALPVALRTVEAGPNDVGGYSVAGIVLLDSQRPQEALRYLEEAVRRTPNDPSRLAALGVCYERLELFDKSFACHKQAATLSPNDPRAIINVGSMLARVERFAEAEPWFQQALALDSNYSLAIEQLATVKLGLRDFGGAIALMPQVDGLTAAEYRRLSGAGRVANGRGQIR